MSLPPIYSQQANSYLSKWHDFALKTKNKVYPMHQNEEEKEVNKIPETSV